MTNPIAPTAVICARCRQVRASVDLVTTPPEVLRKRRHAEHMSRVDREALADAILGMGKGQESRTFVDVVYRARFSGPRPRVLHSPCTMMRRGQSSHPYM